jgi:hypothetical protein
VGGMTIAFLLKNTLTAAQVLSLEHAPLLLELHLRTFDALTHGGDAVNGPLHSA